MVKAKVILKNGISKCFKYLECAYKCWGKEYSNDWNTAAELNELFSKTFIYLI